MAESTTTFTIRTVGSESDARTIETELEAVDGVMEATVEESGSVEVRYDQDLISEKRPRSVIEGMGHEID